MCVCVCVFTMPVAHRMISRECFILQGISRGGLHVVGLTLAARESDSYSVTHAELLSVGNDNSSLSKLGLQEPNAFLIFPSNIFILYSYPRVDLEI